MFPSSSINSTSNTNASPTLLVLVSKLGFTEIWLSFSSIWAILFSGIVSSRDSGVSFGSATIKAKDGTVRNMMSFGEAADNNLMGGGKKFPVAMAEKRAMSRVVLKIAGFYEQGVFGQDEIVD